MSTCKFCGGDIPKSRQKPTFCSTACRGRYHEGCRKLGERMHRDGAVSIEQIRSALDTA